MPTPKKPSTEPAKRGRPNTYTKELAEEICARLSEGEPLASICRDDKMPSVRTVSDWKRAHDEFSTDFVRAREEGYDAIAADCLFIADDTTRDTISSERGGVQADTEWISRSKLRVDTRLKLLARWDPKRYGERFGIGGAPDLPPIKTQTTLDVSVLSTEVLAELMKARDAADGE